MSGAREGWYIAEIDGSAIGPMSREELLAWHARGGLSADALAWHLELSEWRPLARIVLAGSGGATGTAAAAGGAAPAPPRAETKRAESKSATATATKAERRARVKAQRQASAAAGASAASTRAAGDDGKRLLAHTAQAQALKAAFAGGRKPAAAATTASPESAAHAALALRRFFARAIDTFTLGMFAAVLAWVVLRRVGGPFAGLEPEVPLLMLLAVVSMVPLEALALTMAGTTPGKALLGVRVVASGGARPSFAQAFRRARNVAWRGMGLGIPMIALFTAIFAFARLVNKGHTHWDHANQLETRSLGPFSGGRWQLALAVLIGAFVLLTSSFWPELARRLLAASAR